MLKKYIPGELRVREDSNEKWTAEQWTGSRWLFLQIKETRRDINLWLENEWKRHPVDPGSSD